MVIYTTVLIIGGEIGGAGGLEPLHFEKWGGG